MHNETVETVSTSLSDLVHSEKIT